MKIAIPNGTGGFHLFTNEDLQVGDKVYPMTNGYNDGKTYYVIGLNADYFSGWPDAPHEILDLHHSDSKAYQIRTDHGYGPIEAYFKLINPPPPTSVRSN